VELWIDPDPNAQLSLIWLLDFLRGHGQLAAQMEFVQADFVIGSFEPDELAKWQAPRVSVGKNHLDLASTAWRAYFASTLQDFFKLLETCFRNCGGPWWTCLKSSLGEARVLVQPKCGCSS
jgi:hypothetical protein